MDYSQHFNTKNTPQNRPIPGREKDMKQNEAGGFGFISDPWNRLDRFLFLGSEGGTYYVGERELTIQNASNVIECIKQDGVKVVDRIVKISTEGSAPKNDPAIFALALACALGDEKTKKIARASIFRVCRTGTHIFNFCEAYKKLGRTSRQLKRGIAEFYMTKTHDKLAYQLVKYRQRNGWTHRDVIRLAHPKFAKDDFRTGTLAWALGKPSEVKPHPLVEAFKRLQAASGDPKMAAKIIRDTRAPWEAVPTELHGSKEVWEALLPDMPYMALVRNIGRLSSVGIASTNLSPETALVTQMLTNKEAIEKSLIHPFAILLAYATYRQGRGMKGSLKWEAASSVLDALEAAFFAAFKNVQPIGVPMVVGVDISGSMSTPICNSPLSAAQGALLMSHIHRKTEPASETVFFNEHPLGNKVRAGETISALLDAAKAMLTGGTDCAAPIIWAGDRKVKVDAFVIYTDSETWAGQRHGVQVLEAYRKHFNPKAKLVSVEMASTSTSIADAKDPLQLSIAGMDANVPSVVRQFILG